MSKMFYFLLALSLPFGVFAQTTLYSENFETGGASIAINTSDLGGVAVGTNPWIINNVYAGGSGSFTCAGFPISVPFTVPAAPQQPAGITNNPTSFHLHITPEIAITAGGTLPAASYVVSDGLCIVGASSNFAKMTSNINTTGYDSVVFDHWWACGGSSAYYGELYYSINGGSTWVLVTNPNSGTTSWYDQTTWKNEKLSMPIWENQTMLRFGFRFISGAAGVGAELDPGYTIDDIEIIGYTAACTNTASTITASACETYTSPSGMVWTSSNTYMDTIPNVEGCDSIITVNLTILNNAATISVFDCESYTSPSGNYTWTTSNTYMDTIANINGCDSVITVNLTIGNSNVTISPTACNSYSSPSGNYTWGISGTYMDTIPGVLGCDSFLTINLTVINTDTSLSLAGTTLTANLSGAGINYQWVDCNNGNVSIPGETNQSFTPTMNGDYAVIIEENGCFAMSSCYNIVVSTIKNITNNTTWALYPNPTTGEITLDFNAITNNPTVEIFNALGQTVSKQIYASASTVSLNLDGVAGIYWVRVQNEGGEFSTFKVLKK